MDIGWNERKVQSLIKALEVLGEVIQTDWHQETFE